MARKKRKMTSAEERAKKKRQAKYEWVFMNGKQVRQLRPVKIDGLDPDEFIRRNADPVCLVQEGMWEELMEYQQREDEWSQLDE